MDINFNGVERVIINVSEHPSMNVAALGESDTSVPASREAVEEEDQTHPGSRVDGRESAVRLMSCSARAEDDGNRWRIRGSICIAIVSVIGVIALGITMVVFHTRAETILEVSAMVVPVVGIYKGFVK